jgi:RNA polymerase sigma-70 factor, ECF subfamily
MNEETRWIQEAREGDRQAYKHLYDTHVDRLFRFLHQFSRNRSDVEEWVQRSFIKAFQQLHAFDGRARFSSWLFRIGINEMKSATRRASPVVLMETGRLPETVVEDDFEWNSTMLALLDELTEAQRMVFVLTEVEGYSHQETAVMMDVAESTSRSLLSRAKHHLRTRWTEEGA